MKKLFFVGVFCLVFSSVVFSQTAEITIIPRPSSVERADGHFVLDQKTRIVARKREDRVAAGILNDYLKANHGYSLKVTSGKSSKSKNIYISDGGDHIRLNSGYGLWVKSDQITIEAVTEAGRYYALQTLFQLLKVSSNGEISVPAVTVNDAARFRYRGMHLDVARHFQPVEFVKKFIDQMSQYKFNYFHWHLTEDQGWRIEIKKYPRLTEIGSKRPESHEGSYSPTFKGDGRPVEGFYTQDEIRDVVAYAKARHITVIPEIELPGHASAALAAYPQFGCKAGYDYKVKMTWGIFKEVYCPTDETFKFLEDVLEETIALFPDSPYIHIGGDEVLKDHWKESEFVQDLMKRENLKDEHEVQSYFVRRIEKFINSKGKKLIGWDEILEGGLAPNATVMSWRGMKGGIEAAKAKHDVIMSPNDFAYFDHGQGDPAYEPLNIGGYTSLEEVYSADIVPKELTPDEAKYIIGGQANLWTEYLETPAAVEYMAFPRMLALAEILWSKKEDRDLADFNRRLNALLPRLDKQNVNYRIPEPVGLQNIVTDAEESSIALSPADGTNVHYTTDGSTPTPASHKYTSPIKIRLKEGETTTLKTIVINRAGRSSSVYAATVLRGGKREPIAIVNFKPGLSYSVKSPSHSAVEIKETGETRSLSLQQFIQRNDLKSGFSVEFSGFLMVPADGLYEFQIESNSQSTFALGQSVRHPKFIEIDSPGTRMVKSAIVPLKAGHHLIRIEHIHVGGEPHFRFRYGIKGRGLNQAYGGEFVH